MNLSNELYRNDTLDRVISVRIENVSSRRKRAKRRARSVDTSDTETSSPDMFYISRRKRPSDPECIVRASSGQPVHYWAESSLPRPLPYRRHNNLDVYPLSVYERLHLARIHYGTIANLVRLVTLLICFSLFGYYSHTIIDDFSHFDTLIYFANSNPSETTPPAITLCTHCVLCMFKNDSIENVSVTKLMDSNNTWQMSRQNESITELDFRVKCAFFNNTLEKPDKFIDCESIVKRVLSIEDGHKCVTFFSDIYGEMSRINRTNPELLQMKFDYEPKIKLKVWGNFLNSVKIKGNSPGGEDKFIQGDSKGFWTNTGDGNAYTGLYVAVHDPTVLPDMFYIAFHRMETKMDLLVPFVKRIEKLQPAPYQTRCVHYNNRLEAKSPDFVDADTITGKGTMPRSGLRPYRSRGECILYCMYRMLNTARCVNFYSTYTKELVIGEKMHLKMSEELANSKQRHFDLNDSLGWADNENLTEDEKNDKRFCGKSAQSYLEYIHSKETCLNRCPRACLVETYNEDGAMLTPFVGGDARFVTVSWSHKPVLNVVHHAKLSRSEFLGTLGGHAHIWLGFSLIHLVRYLIRMVRSRHLLPITGCCDVIQWWRFWFGKPNQ